MLRRPAARVPVRRPAARGVDRAPARGVEVAKEGSPEEVRESFERGDLVAAADFPVGAFTANVWIESSTANYCGEVCEVAGRVEKVTLEGGVAEAVLAATGTKSENLLKFLTGHSSGRLRAHLCSRECDQLRTNPDLVHIKSFKKVNPEGEKGWRENLVAVDEAGNLRREMREVERDREEKSPAEVSSDRKEKKRGKTKKKAKESGKKKKKKKIGGKSIAKKDLKVVYEGTGLDPEMKRRRKLQAYVRKKLKKGKDVTSSSSSSSSSGSGSEGAEVDDELLQDRSRIQRVAALAPGLLAASAVQKMKLYVLQGSGDPWHMEETSLPPVVTQYSRQYLLPRASGGLRREVETLSCVADMMLMGRMAEAADMVCQRLKSLELNLQGQPWGTSQKVEVIPNVEAGVASRAEVQVAQKEAALDLKSKGSYSSWGKEKGKGKGKERDGGKDKGKSKGKAKEEGKKSS